MKLEVLLSCMNQDDLTMVELQKIKSNVLIINQTNKNSYLEELSDDQTIRMISTNSIGLSKSRNLALAHATGDIGILCDDDVIYYNDYEKIILNAFSEIEDADIIIFNIDPINFDGKVKKITQLRKLPKNKNCI